VTVTGGAGFAGKHLVAALRARGENVRIFDLASTGSRDDIQGSITDPAIADAACDGASSVFHLAANAQLWSPDQGAVEAVNLEGTKVMLAAAKAARVECFVHCSSLTTLVGGKTPIGASTANESIRLDPEEMLGPYPRSKLLAEHAVEEAAQDGLNAVIAMPTEPLGPGDESLTPPTQMILDFLNGKTPAYIDCVLNFVPVDSLAEGFIAARDKGRPGERYLLGGENVPMRQLLDMLTKITGKPMPKTKLPYGVALAAGIVDTGLIARFTGKAPKAPLTGVRLAGRQVAFSSEKAKRELTWEAGSVEAALRSTIEWFEKMDLLSA